MCYHNVKYFLIKFLATDPTYTHSSDIDMYFLYFYTMYVFHFSH